MVKNMLDKTTGTVPKMPKKLIGEVLLDAGLISSQQVNIALNLQQQSLQLKLGEILASKGWLKQETVDFFVHFFLENKDLSYTHYQPIGYYFKRAGLLNDEQINIILKEQKKLGIKFCYLAVLKGFVNAKTVDFFLEHLEQKYAQIPIENIEFDRLNPTETVIGDYNFYELIKEQETTMIESEIIAKITNNSSSIKEQEIEFSPIWIDI